MGTLAITLEREGGRSDYLWQDSGRSSYRPIPWVSATFSTIAVIPIRSIVEVWVRAGASEGIFIGKTIVTDLKALKPRHLFPAKVAFEVTFVFIAP